LCFRVFPGHSVNEETMSALIAVVGSLNADFVYTAQRFPAPGETVTGNDFAVFAGGKGANQAFAAARLGGRVNMLGQVGNDTHATWLKENLAGAGVNVSGVLTDPAVSSGVAVIGIDGSGQNQIVVVPGSNGTFSVDRLSASAGALAGAALVLLQLEIPLETVAAAAWRAKEAGATVILDPAPAHSLPSELLHSVDYLTPNETELAALTGGPIGAGQSRAEIAARAQRLRQLGAAKVLVKMGAAGALVVSGTGEHFWPAFAVEAVDSTAAGDAFNGAFAAALAEGRPEIEAGRFAAAAAGCSVTRRGAQPSMPSRAEVEALLKRAS
jgi:ribokinase